MMEQGLSVVDAIEHVRQRRCILPNHRFLRQLRALNITSPCRRGSDKRRHQTDSNANGFNVFQHHFQVPHIGFQIGIPFLHDEHTH